MVAEATSRADQSQIGLSIAGFRHRALPWFLGAECVILLLGSIGPLFAVLLTDAPGSVGLGLTNALGLLALALAFRRRGRGDERGAARLALSVFALVAAVSSIFGLAEVVYGISSMTFVAALLLATLFDARAALTWSVALTILWFAMVSVRMPGDLAVIGGTQLAISAIYPGAILLLCGFGLQAVVRYRDAALEESRALLQKEAQRMTAIEQANDALHASNLALREAQEQRSAALDASEAKSSFLAAMSHEIRTPMTGILGTGDLLRTTTLTATQKMYVDTLCAAGDSLLQILDDILDMSRIEAGRMELEEADFDLRTEILRCVSLMEPAASTQSNILATTIDDELPRVRGDEVRIRQILLNLISNAIKFTHNGSIFLTLGVEAREAERIDLTIAVRDTGTGIAPDQQARLFQPFVQADTSTTRSGGSGLGLAISQRLAAAMGGRIDLESALGEGSTFTLHLSLGLSQARAPEADAPAVATPSRQLRVLVVEDNTYNQMVTTHMLRALGHRVELASNGAQALDHLERDTFDVVLMDCRMPVMDGFEATRRLREREAARGDERMLVIALTASATAEERELCYAAEMDDVLRKPIPLEDLAERLSQIL